MTRTIENGNILGTFQNNTRNKCDMTKKLKCHLGTSDKKKKSS